MILVCFLHTIMLSLPLRLYAVEPDDDICADLSCDASAAVDTKDGRRKSLFFNIALSVVNGRPPLL